MNRLKRREREEIVTALTRRVILIKLDRRIVFANGARRAGVVGLAELGGTVDEN